MPASDALIELFGEELQGKSGTLKTADALDGKKNIMIYFSAHWCPPCRGFTPQLAAKYKASAAANGIEVVFVSSDQDEDGFSSYYGEMPWLALPFGDRDRKAKLSEKYDVKGIPCLVVLDASGTLITTEGRSEVDKYFGGADAAASVASLRDLFGDELRGKTGTVETDLCLSGKKFIMIYFSAHWCPPCRGFTPQLADKYKASAAANGIEVVFVSSDQDQDGFDGYYGEMPWLALPYEDRTRKDMLSEKYGVRGIPTLVVLDGAGNLVTTEGRGVVDKYLPGGSAPCCTIS
eukprot:TRINITY_DN678_c0_g1_i1.p1 TRINITY_DN678_c0_g1~~TRINITY_DN678_c0_g1_i1.p1  ORF type:complete len:309 (+),score=54.63 TRINITY_DN678_c0_g1_i1:56-928(+)